MKFDAIQLSVAATKRKQVASGGNLNIDDQYIS